MHKVILSFFAFAVVVSASAQPKLNFADPQKMPAVVNSDAEESFPILSADGKTLYFARTYHPDNEGGKYAGQDIWFSKLSDGVFSEAEQLKDLNDKRSNVVVGVSADNQRLYLLNRYSPGKETMPGVSVSKFDAEEGVWDAPQAITIPGLEIKSPFYSLFVSPKEDYMLWSIPSSESDTTGNDLYVSRSTDSGKTWSELLPLGPDINSQKDEISPYFDANTKMLYFASNKGPNPDNYDIYYSERYNESWTSWSEPAKAGVNSAGFDAYFFTAENGTAYFSSNKNDSLSNLYISEVTKAVTDTLVEEETEEEEIAVKDTTRREHELIIETGGSETRDRELSDLSREELLDEKTMIRFVYFGFDKYNITPTYIEVLDDVAEILDENTDLYVKINGHTDAVGTNAYNQVLSENRAASTKEWLVMNGVEPSRVKTQGFGESEPYTTNATDDGRAMNRRVEIFFRVKGN